MKRLKNFSTIKRKTNPFVHIIHGYDYNGNRIKRYDPVQSANSELYTYDNLGQIKTLNRGVLNTAQNEVMTVNHSESWNFDKTGNWSQYTQNGNVENRTHNAANELQGIATHDANGNMTLMSGLKGKYDAWNRLVEVRDSNDNLIASYEYNGLNQRIKKTIGSTVTKSFFNGSWQEIESQTGSEITSYIWGLRYIDDLVLRETGEERLYSLADPNWNVVAICDANGDIQECYTYDAFGKQNVFDEDFTIKTGTTFNWNRTFTGQVLDTETGLLLYRTRYLSSWFGRFVNRDIIGYLDGISLYEYVGNSPLDSSDPMGTEEVDIGGKSSTCAITHSSLRFELPSTTISNPIFPSYVTVKIGVKLEGEGSIRTCTKCCRGQQKNYSDQRLTIKVLGRVEITVGWDINKEWKNAKIGIHIFAKGYVGLRGELGFETAASFRHIIDECNPGNPDVFCINPRFSGTIRGGADIRVGFHSKYKFAVKYVVAEVFVQAQAGARFCWNIMPDGSWQYDASKQELYQGRYTLGARLCAFGWCGSVTGTWSP
ncbi:MAG: RHS repeat-associated core domain-containing protein [Planctomycetaceae bacterium]|nr:RHS repeat-associated core domain-containing protein [Planctomycetaceae bacterium]